MEEFLLQQLRAQMGAMQLDENVEKPTVLEEVSVGGIVKLIQKIASSDNPKKILVMTGAGISTAAGIPDFRTPGTGLYDNLQKYNLPEPTAVFDISYFVTKPQPFYDLAKEMYPGKFKPTLSHYFIRLLEQKGLLLRNFTQNVDTLERRANISEDLLVEAHGSFHTAHCITCHKEYSLEFVKGEVFADRLPMCTVPDCAKKPQEEGEHYKGLVKPDIVFFGEALPERFAQLAGKDTKECDLLIIMGTSLTVHPFASLASRVRDDCARILLNLEKVGETNPIMALLGMGTGLNFSEDSYRDVFLQGSCDDGVRELARQLGWEDELMKLFANEHARLDLEMMSDSVATPTAPPTDKLTDNTRKTPSVDLEIKSGSVSSVDTQSGDKGQTSSVDLSKKVQDDKCTKP